MDYHPTLLFLRYKRFWTDWYNIFKLQIDKIVLSVAWYRRLNKRHYLQRFIFQSDGTRNSNPPLPLFIPFPSLPFPR